MSAWDGRLSEITEGYLSAQSAILDSLTPAAMAARVCEIAADHDDWRDHRTLSLNAAENMMSPRARALLAADLATRVTEGFPGDKEFPAAQQNLHIDQIEATVIHLARRMFGCRFVEWRPTSTSMANSAVFFALSKPGDVILSQSPQGGGNYSYNAGAAPRVAGLRVEPLPISGDAFEIDADRAREVALRVQPKLMAIGGSNVLFPYPVAELRQIADEVGAKLVYDAAHLGLLVGQGEFQRPLEEGAHVMTMSSHKIMSGPVGGLICMDDPEIAQAVMGIIFPAFMQTRDQNKYAAQAYAMAEMTEFGSAYAAASVANARALAAALESEGFAVMAANRGYTCTHQIFVYLDAEAAEQFEPRCQAAGVLATKAQHMAAPRGGFTACVRLTSQELTRRGMGASEMSEVAVLIRRLIRDGETPAAVSGSVAALASRFTRTRYTFDA